MWQTIFLSARLNMVPRMVMGAAAVINIKRMCKLLEDTSTLLQPSHPPKNSLRLTKLPPDCVRRREPLTYLSLWRGGRVVECGGLENRCTCKRTEGSNPSLSATFTYIATLQITYASWVTVDKEWLYD